eukprot:TRINITY_DN54_c0_g2_i2.p1 TRINITY_DN54_c0_g2~~TRINITY_DN54_c0_g2_i2.p1  ORF type:complete len:416 (+),score=150.17 TRINITY_DN54_c0_g2_i2:47-1294(+)
MLSTLLPVAAVAAAQSTFVARMHKADAGMLRRISSLGCKDCGTDHGLVDMWQPDGAAAEHVPDWWTGSIDVRGGAELKAALANTTHEVLHHDFEAAVHAERRRASNRTAQADWFDDYHTLAEIHDKLNEWTNTYADVTSFSIGRSYEGTEIHGIRFGSSTEKHATWIQCGIHAREWIAPATCMYFAQKLLDGLKNGDAEVTKLLTKTFVYLVPVLNVDGYQFSWTDNRMWRKNRQPNSGSSFVGTDLNRNWDADWGKCGASTLPFSDTYRGAHVFSAPETTAVRDYFAQLKSEGYRILGGHDFHSYGQLLLRSYGWTNQNAPNNAIEEARGVKMINAIKESSGLVYTNQRSYDLYCCSGLASDFLAEQTTEYSGFTFELRGTPGGFVLPPDQIVSSGEEIYAAMLVWFQEVTYSK